MKRNLSYISRAEQILIANFALLMVLLVFGQFVSDIINIYDLDVRLQQCLLGEEQGGKELIGFSEPNNTIGGYHLMSILVFVAVIRGRILYIAFILVVTYIITLLYSHYSRFRDIESALMGWEADSFNLVVLAFLLVLVVWITSIGFRSVLLAKRSPKLD